VRTLLTVSQVAEWPRVSNMTVYRLIRTRKLLAYRIGRSYRLDPDAVKGFIESDQRASGALASQPEPPGQFVRTP